MAYYSQITDPGLQERIQKRYGEEAAALQALGFRHLAYCMELMGSFSAVLQFLVLILAFFHREVLVVRSPLRLGTLYPLLASSDPPSVALCMGMGVKFYTPFTDGTLLISSSFTSESRPKPESRIVRLPPAGSLGETWLAHRRRSLELASDTRRLPGGVGFSDYVEMSRVEEDLAQYELG
ncbi:MAG TPA: hypothetical protein VFI11_08615 [Anaerolineales bacterium]|nr:hypothetical protein [Anaerolineales bacterium]